MCCCPMKHPRLAIIPWPCISPYLGPRVPLPFACHLCHPLESGPCGALSSHPPCCNAVPVSCTRSSGVVLISHALERNHCTLTTEPFVEARFGIPLSAPAFAAKLGAGVGRSGHALLACLEVIAVGLPHCTLGMPLEQAHRGEQSSVCFAPGPCSPPCALQLGADEVDAHVRSWHKWRRTPPVCQLLLHVGSRAVKQAHAEEQRGPGGRQVVAVPSGEPLAWETLVGWLRELGLLFDQCVAGTNEAQGRCLFFNPSQCSFA